MTIPIGKRCHPQASSSPSNWNSSNPGLDLVQACSTERGGSSSPRKKSVGYGSVSRLVVNRQGKRRCPPGERPRSRSATYAEDKDFFDEEEGLWEGRETAS